MGQELSRVRDWNGVLCGVLSLAVLALIVPTVTFGGINTWTSEGPWGGNVRGLAIDPQISTVLYAGTESSGVWRTVDRGRTWFPANEGLVDTQILSVTTHPFAQERVYVVTPAGPAISVDSATSWTPQTQGLDGVPSGALAIEPQFGTVVYLGTLQDGVFKSENSGFTWEPSNTGLPDAVVTSLVVDPSNADVLYAALDTELVWKSLDAGATWAPVSNGITGSSVRQLSLDPDQPSVLYAATPNGIYKTTNGGTAWTAVLPGLEFGAVAVDPRQPGVVYAGSLLGPGVYRSLDDGGGWSLTGIDRVKTSVSSFVFDPADLDRLYFGEQRGGGVYRSVDGGWHWEARRQGLRASVVWDLAVDSTTSTTFAAVTLDGVARSTPDGGWESLVGSPRNGYCCDRVALDTQQPQTVYAGGLDGMYKSVDGGDTWQRSNQGLSSRQVINDLWVEPLFTNILYVASFDGVYQSVDSGATWERAGADSLNEAVWALALDPSDPTDVVALASGQLYKSTNRGLDWTPMALLPVGMFGGDVAIDPVDPQVLYVTAINGGVLKSTDGGATLFEVASSQEIIGASMVEIDPEDRNRLYVGTFQGLWSSPDGGTTWAPFEGGIDDGLWIRSFAIDRGAVTTYHAGSVHDGAYSFTRGCVDSDTVLCIDDAPEDRRFAVSLRLRTALNGNTSADARATSLDTLGIDDGGIFSFFDLANPEVLVKVIDGCGFNDRFWVFAAATTTLGFELTVEDTLTRVRQTYENPDGQPAATVTDTNAFASCSAQGAGPSDLTALVSRAPVAGSSVVLAPTSQPPSDKDLEEGGCIADDTTLCLDDEPGDRRFAVRLDFDSVLGGGQQGEARVTPLASLGITDGGILSFFDVSNPEVLVKVIDGCGFNNHFWVFAAATTNLGFELTVEDTHTGTVVAYDNPDTVPAETVTDIEALAVCGD